MLPAGIGPAGRPPPPTSAQSTIITPEMQAVLNRGTSSLDAGAAVPDELNFTPAPSGMKQQPAVGVPADARSIFGGGGPAPAATATASPQAL